jgi:tryptophan 2,3-dioxygenase
VQELTAWLSRPALEEFPYDTVLHQFHLVGKHFVSKELLGGLDSARSVLPDIRGPAGSIRLLEQFLDTALDKWDHRYDYPTYLALGLLPLPAVDSQYVACAEWQRDRLMVQLVGDALRFELAAASGATTLLPGMRPDRRTTIKRCRLGVRAIRSALTRLDLAEPQAPGHRGPGRAGAADPVDAAGRVCEAVFGSLSEEEGRALRLSVLPVYVMHDEYLFLRVLQAFETAFGLMAVQLRSAIRALADGDPATAVRRVSAAETELHESAPLFSLLATMQVESFRTFRNYTDGASAIQSRNYKLVEVLCRRPDPARLDSAAYASVPQLRDQARTSLDDAYTEAVASGCLTGAEQVQLAGAMSRFASGLMLWRQTHYRLAVRMLGELRGTGSTEGTPYLREVRTIPVFHAVPPGGHPERLPDDPS